MKKYFCLLVALLMIIICLPVTVQAKNQTVTVSDAKVESSKATVSGKTDALAVMVQVRDSSDNILGLQTFATNSGSFSGEVTGLSLAADTDYKVFVADYEGGDWTTTTVKYVSTSPATPDSTPSNSGAAPAASNVDAMIPKTGIQLSLFIASALAALAVMGVVVIRRRSIK